MIIHFHVLIVDSNLHSNDKINRSNFVLAMQAEYAGTRDNNTNEVERVKERENNLALVGIAIGIDRLLNLLGGILFDLLLLSFIKTTKTTWNNRGNTQRFDW